jgi:hypothetical protein
MEVAMSLFKIKLITLFVLAITFVFSLVGCSSSVPVHNKNEIKKDMIGKEFYYIGDSFLGGSEFKIISENDIKNISITKRLTNQKGKTDEVFVSVSLENDRNKLSGELHLYYRLYDKGWIIDTIEKSSKEDMKVEYKLPPMPNPDKIKNNLVGKEITYKKGFSVKLKSIEGIKALEIKSAIPEDKLAVQQKSRIRSEIVISITMGDSTKSIKGELKLFYLFDKDRYDDGWVFDGIDWANQKEFIEN